MSRLQHVIILCFLSLLICERALGEGTAFTYQGKLNVSGQPTTGFYDLTFSLFTASSGGAVVGQPLTNSATAVTNGLFTSLLDFGSGVFTGANCWLEIGVATNGSATFTTLTPRLQITPAPYAIYSSGSATASSVWASNISGTIAPANLPTNLALLNSNANFSGNVTIGGTNSVAPFTVLPKSQAAPIGSVFLYGTRHPACVALAGRYAYIVGTVGGLYTNYVALQIVDVSNPAMPVKLGAAPAINGDSRTPRSVAVAGSFAFLTDSSTGFLQVFDVSNPSNPIGVGSVNTGGHPSPLGIAGHYAYVYTVTGTGNKLQIYDISNPRFPALSGIADTDGISYSGNSLAIEGRYVYVVNQLSTGMDTLQIIDVGNPTAPVSVASISTGPNGGVEAVAASGRYAYALNSISNNMVVFDVSNPTNPTRLTSIPVADYPSSITVAGRYAYVSSLLTHSVQIIDVSNPASPIAAGSATGTGGFTYCAVSGRYLYATDDIGSTLQVFDLGGSYIQQFEAGTIETGSIQTRDSANVGNHLFVGGGLSVGASAQISSGLGLAGGLNVNAGTLFIANNGTNVGIGTTNPSYTLQVNGSIAGAGPYQNVSDARYKTNVQTLIGALDKIVALRGVSFEWRTNEFPGMLFDQGQQLGFIAQELRDVLPEAVRQDREGHYTVAYSEIIPVLVEAVKQQQKVLAAKDEQLEKIGARLNAMERLMDRSDTPTR